MNRAIVLLCLFAMTLSGCMFPDAQLRQASVSTSAPPQELRLERLDDEAPAKRSSAQPNDEEPLKPGTKLLVFGIVLTVVGLPLVIGGGYLLGKPCHESGALACLGDGIAGGALVGVGASLLVPGVIMTSVGGYRYSNAGTSIR